MTWAKYGNEFWTQVADAGLSDAAARTHAEAIAHLYDMEPAGLVLVQKRHMLRRIAGTDDPGAAMAELVAAGFWTTTPEGWALEHHADVVRGSLAYQVTKREQDRERQRAKREKDLAKRNAKGRTGPEVGPGVTRDVRRDVTHDVAATQTDSLTNKRSTKGGAIIATTERVDRATGEALDPWPDVAKPGQGGVSGLEPWGLATVGENGHTR